VLGSVQGAKPFGGYIFSSPFPQGPASRFSSSVSVRYACYFPGTATISRGETGHTIPARAAWLSLDNGLPQDPGSAANDNGQQFVACRNPAHFLTAIMHGLSRPRRQR
jgi:hypothetical protein